MALRKLSSLLLVAQLLLVVVGGASAIVARGTQLYTTGYFPQIDCSPAPMATSTGSNGTAFRANLLTLLASLPDQAAPTGFASMQAGAGGRAPGGDDDDRAFARGACLGDSTPSQCRDCLAAAVIDVAEGCGADTRRAGAWLSGCYLAYADTDATSPRESAFHRWFFDGDILPFSDNLDPTFLDLANGAVSALAAAAANRSGSGRTMLAATQEFDDGANTGLAGSVLAQCAAGRAPADCVQCLQDSARAMPRCCWNAWGLGESVAVALSYDYVLQVHHAPGLSGGKPWWRSSPSVCPRRWSSSASNNHVVVVVVMFESSEDNLQ